MVKVRHRTAGWIADVESVEYDYAYGLGKRSKEKMKLYTLKNVMGKWSDRELEEVKRKRR